MPTNTPTGMAAHLDAEAISAADHAKLKDRARKAREKGRGDSVYTDAIAAMEAPTPAGDAAGLVESQERVSDAVHKALWDADATIAPATSQEQRHE